MNDDVFSEVNLLGDDAALQLAVVLDRDAIVKDAVSGMANR